MVAASAVEPKGIVNVRESRTLSIRRMIFLPIHDLRLIKNTLV
jgi:hypothetical protein